jgi:hypothetical protein
MIVFAGRDRATWRWLPDAERTEPADQKTGTAGARGGEVVNDEKIAIAKTLPAIAGATIYGLTLQDWVALATLVYVGLQVGLLLPKYWRLLRDWRNGRKS